jgi:hypothetical protein
MSAATKAKFHADFRAGIEAFERTRLAKVAANVTSPKTGPNVLNPFKPAPAKTVNADGTPFKPQTSSTITHPGPVVTSGSGPILAAGDRSRTPAKPPASVNNDDFVSINLRPGEVDVLAQHGISVGIRQGMLSIKRLYEPAALGILQQARGG